MIQVIDGFVYKYCKTGDWLRAGKIVKGFDGYYIQWFA